MKNCPRIYLIVFLFLLVYGANAQTRLQTVKEIMAEPPVAGRGFSGEKLSPDGTKVIFMWNAENKPRPDLYIVSAAGGTPQKIMSYSDLPASPRPPERENKLDYGLTLQDEWVKERQGQLGNFEWAPDSRRLLFTHAGDLFTFDTETKETRRYTRTMAPEGGARFLDNNRILFSQSGHLFILDTVNTMITQISRESNPQGFISVFGGSPSKDGSMIAYTVSDSSSNKALIVPNFLPEFVSAMPTRRGWTTQKVMVTKADGSRERAAEIKLPKPEGVSSIRRIVWAADNRSLFIDRIDKDTKRRQLFYVHNAGEKDEKIISVTEETDDKWQASLSFIVEPNPKETGKVVFGSERDGYNHLYLATVDPAGEAGRNVRLDQLTKGNWQVEWAKWNGGDQVVYMSTESTYKERDFYVFNTASGEKTKLGGSPKGMKGSPSMSDIQGTPTLLYENSTWNTPGELYAERVCTNCQSISPAMKLTNATPEDFKTIKWIEPKFVEIDSRDG